MSKKNTLEFVVGEKVEHEIYGEGEIVKIAEQEGENGKYFVYHVLLVSGETRHFTAEELYRV